MTEGPAPALRPLPARSTLAAPRTITGPVPDRCSSPSLDVAPRTALRRFLGRSAKMPRIRFYNRRSRHEHPKETSLSETARRAPWETRRRSTSRPPSSSGFRLSRSSGAGPPCGHPTSNGCALDGVLPASGPSTTSFWRTFRCMRRGAQAFSAEGTSVESNPLTPLIGAGWGSARTRQQAAGVARPDTVA